MTILKVMHTMHIFFSYIADVIDLLNYQIEYDSL